MRIRDWSSDVCSSDLPVPGGERVGSGGEGQAAEVQHGGPGRDDGACSACDADAPVVGGGDGGGAGDGVGHAGAAGARVAHLSGDDDIRHGAGFDGDGGADGCGGEVGVGGGGGGAGVGVGDGERVV